jgi:hypothetical protein
MSGKKLELTFMVQVKKTNIHKRKSPTFEKIFLVVKLYFRSPKSSNAEPSALFFVF